MTDKDFSFDNNDESRGFCENSERGDGDASGCTYGNTPPEVFRDEGCGFCENSERGDGDASGCTYGNTPPEVFRDGRRDKNGENTSGERYVNGDGSRPPYSFPQGDTGGFDVRNITRDGLHISKTPLKYRISGFFYSLKTAKLTLLGTIGGCAIMLYQLFSFILSTAVSKSPLLSDMYASDELFRNFFGMLYSVICVGIPFAAAFIVLRRCGYLTLPLDAPKKGSGLPLLIIGGLGIFYIGNLLTTFIITTLSGMGIELYSYTQITQQGTAVPEGIFEFLVMCVHSAVIPAVIEEFAFRGVIMQPLRKYGDWFAVISSAVLFGLLHGNMMQMPFAVVAGIVLGYVTVVTGSMWTGILLHFLNNFLSLCYSILGELLSDSVRVLFSAVYTYGIIIIGLVALAGYAFYNPDFYRLYPSQIRGLKTKTATGVYFLVPPMLIAIIFMLSAVVKDFYIA